MSDTNELRAVKLTATQRRVIGILGHEAQTSSRLAYTLGRNDSSCRSLVQRLKDRGFVTSVGRSGVLLLTDAGRALLSTSDARAPSVEEGKHG